MSRHLLFRLAALPLMVSCAGAAQAAASGESIKECVSLSGSQQVSRFGNQYVLVRDGDAYYRLIADSCDKLPLATSFVILAESQEGRVCPTGTQVRTNVGKCRISGTERIDEATYLRYQRKR